jgi:hypothetical protein
MSRVESMCHIPMCHIPMCPKSSSPKILTLDWGHCITTVRWDQDGRSGEQIYSTKALDLTIVPLKNERYDKFC